MPFSNVEACEMMLCLGECNGNAATAAQTCARKLPNLPHRSAKIIINLAKRLASHGVVQPRSSHKAEKIRRPVRDDIAKNIFNDVISQPNTSYRLLERSWDGSRNTTYRILKQEKFHSYHPALCQHLMLDDPASRLRFCNWACERLDHDQFIYNNILWTDEAAFRNDDNLNAHNMSWWSDSNPYWLRTVDQQQRWTLNTWCGVIYGRIHEKYAYVNDEELLKKCCDLKNSLTTEGKCDIDYQEIFEEIKVLSRVYDGDNSVFAALKYNTVYNRK